MTQGSPVFIHAWWRSSSTYLWSKLRQNDSLCCYYEPLHEQIATLNREELEAPHRAQKSRILRHPVPEKGYYAEYLKPMQLKTLRYARQLAYRRYLLRPEQPDEMLRTYLDGLIFAAGDAGQRAVLCFCRSQMRSAWIRHAFGGVHVAQVRNPYDQWKSFHIQPYFLQRLFSIALRLDESTPGALSHINGLPELMAQVRNMKSNGQPAKTPVRHGDMLSIFLLVWIASSLQAISHSDYVLDVDRLSADADHRREASAWFGTQGLGIDLSDCSTPSSPIGLAEKDLWDAKLQEALKAIRSNASLLVIADRAALVSWLPQLSAESRRVLEQASG